MERIYVAIDLKSFYASVECVSRGLDPMTTNLVVADLSRTSKTICLAVSPSLKSWGIPGRPRLFEVEQRVGQINALRRQQAPGRCFSGKSWDHPQLCVHPELELDYIVAPPRMALYMQTSASIYEIYLKYISPQDIHVYSIDEVFLDITGYLKTYGLSAWELTRKIILDVLSSTGITATAGIGTNLYLCKVAMDIKAKHIPPDENGVRIAQLDEMDYRRSLWAHRPLTDFWRVGRGYAKKLEAHGLYTMGDIARCSLGRPGDFHNEDLLYKLFGVNAELLIDHAWGWESCTIAQIKAYRPGSHSIGSGQVLQSPYPFDKARLVLREMADSLSLDLVEKQLAASQIILTIGYDRENTSYQGATVTDHYGRKIPKHAHGSVNLPRQTSSTRLITDAAMDLFDRITDHSLLIRRLNIVAGNVVREEEARQANAMQQLDLFAPPEDTQAQEDALEREKRRQQALLSIQHKYGKNAILKGTSFREGATARDRNQQIGGHKA